ncbi:acyltransferase [Sphaerisporangium sp. NPDC088356]|uniref:acyltransferase family protein n=1 Tax=Sphaerisporangium sp. NPDC088356 TaxID=3154871 RepID=UPI003426B406
MHRWARAQNGGRLDSLTGGRFIAALMVFVFHIATLQLFAEGSGVGSALTFATKTAGTIGVSFFFVLSGFVLTWSARSDDSYAGFLRRRLVKIYPNHVVTFCLAMLVFAAAATPTGTAVLNLLLLQAWAPRPDIFLSVNGPSWSLSCELVFYLLFPLLLPRISRIAGRRLWWWAAGVAALIVMLPGLAHLLPADPVFDGSLAATVLGGESISRMWFVYILPPVRLLDFVLGMLSARIVISGHLPRIGVVPAASIAALGYVAGLFAPMLYVADAVTVVPLALLVAALASADARGFPTLLGCPLMRRLGEISFAFYLIQEIVLVSMRAMVGFDRHLDPLTGLLFGLAAFCLSLLLAYAMHRWVETPAVRRWGRHTPPAVGRPAPRKEAAA